MAAPLPALFGRDIELAWLVRQLEESVTLVTLTGAAGMGKTRLARALVEWVGEDAAFCEAIHARNADDLCAVVARGLGLSLGEDTALETRTEAIGRAIARYRVVVLDNLEQVVDAAAALVDRWTSPGTLLVVTSRTALALGREKLLELSPLSLEAAIALFEERAKRLRPDFDSERSREAVAAIARELDGVPLAIELAASRSRVLDPDALLARMRDRFALLRSRNRDSPWPALDQAIDWSWQLLDEREQAAAAQCTAFRGPFDLEAAEAVLDGDEALELLDSLRDKSMLVAHQDDRLRLGMLASIREFCAAKLPEPDRESLHLRHAAHFRAVATRWAPGADAGHLPSVRELSSRQDDLRVVVERYLQSETHQRAALECLIALASLVETEGVPAKLESSFDEAIANLAPATPPALAGRLRLERSTLLRLRGRLDESRADARRALDLARDSPSLRGHAHRRLGMLDVDIGATESAIAHLEKACALHAEAGDDRARGIATSSLARATYAAGDLESAERHCLDALESHEREALDVWEGLTRGYLAYICMDGERYEDARTHLERALTSFRTLGSLSYEGAFVGLLGTLHHLLGELEAALADFGRARDAMEQSGRRRLAAIHAGNEGIVLLELERLDLAEARLQHAMDELAAVGDESSRALFQCHAAGCAISRGRFENARARLDQIGNSEGTIGQIVTLQRTKLGVATAARGKLAHAQAEARETIASCASDARGDVRLALREVRRFVDAMDDDSGEVLRVAADGSGFEYAATRVDLRSREVLARMLVALTRNRLEGDGRGMSPSALIEETWPGERMTESSAASRLHSTIRRLRKMGLADRLLHEHGHYLLEPSLDVVFDDDSITEW